VRVELLILFIANCSLSEGLYNETFPTDLGDRMNASLPTAFLNRLNQIVTPHTAKTIDQLVSAAAAFTFFLFEFMNTIHRSIIDGLAKTNFKTNFGPNDHGLFALFLGRGGGYYLGRLAFFFLADYRV
jgi:hypothetical protein